MASEEFDSSADLFDDSEIAEISISESSSSDNEIIGRKKKNIRRLIESDDDEDKEEVKALMSPRTRRSIGFSAYRTSKESDSDSEIESDAVSESVEVPDETEEEESDEDAEDETKNDESKFVDTSAKSGTLESQHSTDLFDESTMLKTIDDEHVPVLDLTQDTSDRTSLPCKSTLFEHSIAEKLSSTQIGRKQELDDSSVIEILDESDPSPENKVKVQPTIEPTRLVSRSFYYDEARKIDEIKQKIKTIESLYKKSGADLPDKGASLQRNLEGLKVRLEVESKKLEKLEIDEGQSLKRSFQNDQVVVVEDHKPPEKGTINWEEIKKANALVQPKFTGTQGLKTFGDQKERVEKGLNRIHGSLADQPTEEDHEPTPEDINIELMDHQKSGLRWMLWRETCRPRGGILADDMGLGKTLSMIALVLAKLDSKEDEEAEANDSDASDDSERSWKNKRRDEKYRGGTLIVCPASLLGQWENEVKNRVRRGCVEFQLHHGPKRELKAKRLARIDIVCTTYQIANVELENGGPLFRVKWNRVILDEAHMIRNHKAKISIACSQLNAKYRWALTGTPICNKEIDVYALLRFLRVSPFDDLPTYKRWLEDKKGGGGPRLHALIKTLMLRRTKKMLQEKQQLSLPEREWKLVPIEFSPQESAVYQKVLAYSRELFTQYLAEKNNEAERGKFDKMHERYQRARGGGTVQVHQILVLLLRLRQICCHPGLINTMIDDTETLEVSTSAFDNSDLLNRLAKIDLNATVDETDDDDDVARMSAALMNKSNPVFNFENPSAKIRYVIEHFRENIMNTDEKAVFVSQWTSFLELFRDQLSRLRVKFCEINGSVPVKDRGEIVSSFNAVGRGPKVMLLALTAGGVGLNLVGANHLYLLDLHWNPQLENQAQDRIYRVGQQKKVFVYKFMVQSAIEERIYEIQKKKLELANSVMTGAKNLGSKLSIQDLRALFEI